MQDSNSDTIATSKASKDASEEASIAPELLEKLRFTWQELPTISAELEGTGGVIRQEITDFQVTEQPLYRPQGSGSHLFIWLEKRGLTTRDVVLALLEEGLHERDIGVAGLKDKHAITRQWISVPKKYAKVVDRLAALEGIEVLAQDYHKNKLAIGHLLGNHFRIHVRQTGQNALEKAQVIVDKLKKCGVPNYFGAQRFGRFGTNAIDGYKLLHNIYVPGGHRLKRFFVSALQSHVFNHILKLRLERGVFDGLLTGDWAKKHDTGGIFQVQDVGVELSRAKALDISATIPLYGKKVRLSEAQAGECERKVLENFGLRWTSFANHKIGGRKGDRRITRVKLEDVVLEPSEAGYWLSFSLRKGAFATTILREVMKVDVDNPIESTKPAPDAPEFTSESTSESIPESRDATIS